MPYARFLTGNKASVVNPEKRCQPKNPDILAVDALETRLITNLLWVNDSKCLILCSLEDI
jgi:hypothetical protein